MKLYHCDEIGMSEALTKHRSIGGAQVKNMLWRGIGIGIADALSANNQNDR